MAVSYDGSSAAEGHGYQAHIGPMRPTSRGFVKLKSADPREHPRVLFNYMQTEQDRREMRAGIKLTREIFLPKGIRSFPWRGARAGASSQERCRHRSLRPRQGGERLSPVVQLPHGNGRDGRR